MKKIFVTVTEFVANGGKMISEDGRPRSLFNRDGMRYAIYSDLYKSILETDSDAYYVQIDCTPHYI